MCAAVWAFPILQNQIRRFLCCRNLRPFHSYPQNAIHGAVSLLPRRAFTARETVQSPCVDCLSTDVYYYTQTETGTINEISFFAYSPPNSCMPSRAKMRMKRNRRNRSEMMERMLLSSEMTRFRSEGQYLYRPHRHTT